MGLAQAIIHNPDVLILDEPTAGLDPKQIIETRQLIKELSGSHTIILSTHILPEVEQTCERVVIISKGKLVATDSVQNLTNRLRGAEAVSVEVEGRGAELDTSVIQRKLEQVSGVSRVIFKETRLSRHQFEVESLQGKSVRAEVARAVVEAGWNLTELRAVGFSLEDVFLQLTASDASHARGSQTVKNILVICRKELKSYFASPIAYGLMAVFAVIAGYFFYVITAVFVQRGMEAQMMGRGMPMDVNEWVVRGFLSNVSVIGLFLVPMITMRLFAEEKRTGTIELLVTSPVKDIEIIMGKWLAALLMYSCILAISAFDLSLLFLYGKPDWKPILIGYLGLLLQGGCLLAIGTFISTTTQESDHRRHRDICRMPASMGFRLGELRTGHMGEGDGVPFRGGAF